MIYVYATARSIYKLTFLFFILMFCKTHSVSGQSYCTPQYSVDCQFGDYISNFQFNTISNSSNCSQSGYGDFTNLSTILTPGKTYTARITCGFSSQYIIGWIDYNNDKNFSNSEQIITNLNCAIANTQYTASVTIPANAQTGSHRMRIRGVYSTQNFSACKSYYYGETEDYQVIIADSSGVDVAINSVLKPDILKIGSDSIQIEIINVAKDTIQSVDIGYRLGSNNAVTSTLSGINLLKGQSYIHTFTVPINIAASGTYRISSWARNPNNNYPDNDSLNDTLLIDKCTGLSGSYTLDTSQAISATNFHTFNEITDALIQCGISGPCYFSISPGTYYENISIPTIQGSSAINTITFDGGQSGATNLQSSQAYTLQMSGASYFTFKNITLENTNSGAAITVQLLNSANNNNLDSCHIISTNNNVSNYSIGIMGTSPYAPGKFGNYNSIRNCEIENGYYAIVIAGTTNFPSLGNSIYNNYIHHSGYAGLFCNNTDSTIIDKNIFENTSAGINIYLYYAKNTNVFSNSLLSNYYNIYSSNCSGIHTINNFLQGSAYSNIYCFNLKNADFWHNSIYNSSAFNMSYNAVHFVGTAGGTSNIDFRNNIIALDDQNTNMFCLYGLPNYFNFLDYNNFYNSNSNNFVNLGGIYNGVNALKGQHALNDHVFNSKPSFLSVNSPANLHLTSTVSSLSGDGTLPITTDIDGDARCSFAPSLGADESKYKLSKPVSNFKLSDTAYINSPVSILNSATATESKKYLWSIDGIVFDSSLDIKYTFTSAGQHQIKLLTRNCSGMHDTAKYIYIVSPSSKPVSDFIANSNIIENNDEIIFSNLSQGGDTAWLWSITPGIEGVDWSYISSYSSSTYETRVQFNTPGKFSICLTAYNRNGMATACKQQYIEVLPSVNICANNIVKTSKGKFYDDGGKTGIYSSNNQCSMLLDPCASSLSLSFKSFDVVSGAAYLKIWDGKDAISGRALHSGQGWTGNSSPGFLTAKSGKMYIEWTCNSNVYAPGWEAEWNSTPGKFMNPSAEFFAPSTGYNGGVTTCDVKNYSNNTSYEWWIGGNKAGTGKTLAYTFNSIGTYSVCLVANSCGGSDTVCKTVSIVNPNAAPSVDFKVNYRGNINSCYTSINNQISLNAGDTISLIDLSTQGPKNWSWTGSPANHIIWIDNASDQNPSITFDSTCIYHISLTASNGIGASSLTKTNFITVGNGFCAPSVSNLISDIGINSVKFEAIDNTSTSGVQAYTDYGSKQSACVAVGGKYLLNVSRNSNMNPMNMAVWIDLNQDASFSQSERIAYQTSSYNQSWFDTIQIPTKAQLGQTKMRIGAAFGSQTNAACGPNQFGEFEDYNIYISPDNDPPLITLYGNDTIQVEQGRTFVDPGATSWDAVDGHVSVKKSGSFNNLQIGFFPIYYDAQDNAGNNAVRVKRIIEITPDVSGPSILLSGNNPMYIETKNVFNDPGASAYDSVTGLVNNSQIIVSGGVNTSVIGNYFITYKACDTSNNCDSVVRTVTVGDTTKPVITIIGNNPENIPVYQSYFDPGASASDNYWNNLTVNTFNWVNENIVGTYLVRYYTADGSGNSKWAYRTVNVIDSVNPSIQLFGGDTLYIEATANATFKDPGYFGYDNYYPQVNVTVSGSVTFNKALFNQPQIITYTATDGSGNTSGTNRVVYVRKTSKPLLTLNGNSLVRLDLGDSYTDPGVVMKDAYYSNAELLPGYYTKTNFNKDLLGVYQTYYFVKDPMGNEADTVWRVLEVGDKMGLFSYNTELEQFNVFPNPSSGIFFIEMQLESLGEVSLEITNAIGEIVFFKPKNKFETIFRIDLTKFASGFYSIKLISQNQVFQKQLLIAK